MPQVQHFLDALDPRLRVVLLATLTFAVLFAWRKLHPSSFEKLPQPVREFQALFVGAAMAALTAHVDGLASSLVDDAGTGAFAGLGAIGLHWFLKNTPWIPYGGPGAATMADAAKKTASTLIFLVGCAAAVLLPACTTAQPPGVLPVLTAADAVRVQTESVLEWIREHLPGDDDTLASKYAAAEKAYREKDYVYALTVGQEILELLARSHGEVAPAAVVADTVTGAQAAQVVQDLARALAPKPAPEPEKPAPEPTKPAETPGAS
jgi:hypothetical protein